MSIENPRPPYLESAILGGLIVLVMLFAAYAAGGASRIDCHEQAVVTLSPDVTALDCRAAQIEIVESQAGTFLAWCKCSEREGGSP